MSAGRTPGAQLALGFGFSPGRRLDNFVPGPNAATLAAVRAIASGESSTPLYLRGPQATGKTHLLQGCCAAAQAGGERVAYLPLGSLDEITPAVLGGLHEADVLCIDDVDGVAGDPAWETALFHLYNEAEARGARLVFSGRGGPNLLQMPDLASRLAAGLMLVLLPPDDALRRAVLNQQASELGFELGDEVAEYILARAPRDLERLSVLVASLDRYALAAKRRVTVVLVREFLAAGEAG